MCSFVGVLYTKCYQILQNSKQTSKCDKTTSAVAKKWQRHTNDRSKTDNHSDINAAVNKYQTRHTRGKNPQKRIFLEVKI